MSRSTRDPSNRSEIMTMLRSLLSLGRRVRGAPRRYARDARGNFTIMFALIAPVLVILLVSFLVTRVS